MKLKDEYNRNKPFGFSVFLPWLSLSLHIFLHVWHDSLSSCISSRVAGLQEGRLLTSFQRLLENDCTLKPQWKFCCALGKSVRRRK